jgi:DNA-binding CsgD family transcriptional regulator
MEVLDELVRSPLVPALALLHAWDYAQRRLRRCLADQTHLLTPRETQVLSMVAAGHTNRRIGHRLGLSERTVRKHLENINDKLGTVNRAAAVDRWRGRPWNLPPVPAEVRDG